VSKALGAEEGLGSVVASESLPEASVASVVEEALGSEVEEQQVVMETLEPEVVAAVEEVLELETTVQVEAIDAKLPADVCAPRGLEYPTTFVGEVPAAEESEMQELVDPINAEGESPAVAEVAADVEDDTTQVVLEHETSMDDATELSEAADPDVPSTDGSEAPATADECTAPSTDDVNAAFETDPESDTEAANRCSMDVNSDSDAEDAFPTASASASTTSLFIPGPYVTERKTVRVFETVTETVRVSVVTQTETVSTVVTAVPQTVEETVYETETVRITVSVPVEEQKKRAKAKETKGCRKWF
jgi:hypothetical protein